MSAQPELLPCAHCGGEAKKRATDFPGLFIVGCRVCGIATPLTDEAEAIAAWNRRAATTPAPGVPREPLEKLIRAWSHDAQNQSVDRPARAMLNVCAESLRAALAATPTPQAPREPEKVRASGPTGDPLRDTLLWALGTLDICERFLSERDLFTPTYVEAKAYARRVLAAAHAREDEA